MGPSGNLRTVKKYKKGNITAAFGVDLFIHGSTAIPNLLLKFYKQLGITDTEMMLIIQLLRIRTEEKIFLPTLSLLSSVLSEDEEQIARNLESLVGKEMLKITEFFDAEKGLILRGYDFEPLFEKLSEFWACAKVKENEKIKNILDKEPGFTINLYKGFEKEFGRPLSPMEVEQINIWSQKMKPVMVLEALRRAVLMGKHNFKYIDGILLEWEKNNINCPEDIAEYDRQYKMKRTDKKKNDGNLRRNSNSDKTDKKSLIKSLYMN
ncbi:DnaD domain protein [Desulfallas sp. Bu1-1]|jgi:DNA replication protein|uniref:DnaD domain-containing protein n=1 Tax=Desulfallas sp. Bu1-1 TaxID=2787620 RepID=UPI00189E6E87|nr:DnaD domain protein [Desulfallas sp. Bu1-1]MBF7083286.1 DnaD domain protein [Desulfallas sp. Bu1-1]